MQIAFILRLAYDVRVGNKPLRHFGTQYILPISTMPSLGAAYWILQTNIATVCPTATLRQTNQAT